MATHSTSPSSTAPPASPGPLAPGTRGSPAVRPARQRHLHPPDYGAALRDWSRAPPPGLGQSGFASAGGTHLPAAVPVGGPGHPTGRASFVHRALHTSATTRCDPEGPSEERVKANLRVRRVVTTCAPPMLDQGPPPRAEAARPGAPPALPPLPGSPGCCRIAQQVCHPGHTPWTAQGPAPSLLPPPPRRPHSAIRGGRGQAGAPAGQGLSWKGPLGPGVPQPRIHTEVTAGRRGWPGREGLGWSWDRGEASRGGITPASQASTSPPDPGRPQEVQGML